MYGVEARRQALALIDNGFSLRAVSLSTGISRATLREWRDDPQRALSAGFHCPRCAEDPVLPEPRAEYSYLLGLYLGDGCISVAGAQIKEVWKLRIFCGDAWPGLIGECMRSMRCILPGSKVMTWQRGGCTEVFSYSKHWPCLFPQHGAGKKHLRRIVLQSWQQSIVAELPGEFARGLLHSDGWRGVNRVRRTRPDGDRRYEYPRYLFTNESTDILELCGTALDRLGVDWRFSQPNVISVAKRDAVARLDAHVGPKY
jgi:hypothetical protein